MQFACPVFGPALTAVSLQNLLSSSRAPKSVQL